MSRTPRMLLVMLVAGSSAIGQVLTPAQAHRFDEHDGKPLLDFSNVDLAEYLQLRALVQATTGRPDPADDVTKYALKGLDTAFQLPAKRFDLRESDCVVFVERILAIALADDWHSYYLLCERLRHKDGIVNVLERNFFTLADWVPSNSWLLRDITQELGVPATPFEYASYPRRFFERLEFGEDETPTGQAKAALKAAKIASLPEKIVHADHYIPRESIAEALPMLSSGDVVLVIHRRSAPGLKPWVYCDHMGVLLRSEDGSASLIQSTPPKARKQRLTNFLLVHPQVAGFKFLRLADDARDRVEVELDNYEEEVVVVNPEELDPK